MKKQVILIHGGMTFDTYDEYLSYLKSCTLSVEKLTKVNWKDNLASNLSDFQVLYPKMPNSKNAKYLEWKIWFEKMFDFMEDDIILVGHSLGGIFLAKYLSENPFPKKIKSIHLVAAPYDTEHCEESLGDFVLNGPVSKIENLTDKIFIYQSKDDPEVSPFDAEKYQRDLPKAKLIMFENRGHFLQNDFPELIKNIKDS